MKEIHFGEREHVQGLTQVCPDRDEWESGDWSVRREKAFELINREFYLHRVQKKPAFFAGIIIGFYCIDTQGVGRMKERIVFRIRRVSNLEGKVTPQEGWGNEQKTVY